MMAPSHARLLLLAALITLAACQAPPNVAPAANTTAPNAAAGADADAGRAPAPPPPPTRASIDQVLPHFRGIRSCLPFNILVAAPQPQPGGSDDDPSSATTNGRLTFSGDFAVAKSTAAAIQGGILTLSLTGTGFYSDQPIHLTVTVPPSGGNLSSISNFGPGLVVLGPGIKTDELRVYAPTVGQVRAINLTADKLTFTGSGVLGSSLQGAFKRVTVNTGAATGSVAVTSITPVAVTANLGGITTLSLNVPAGTTIDGSAGGLSKVQFTAGQCNIGSPEAAFQFPAFDSFGGAFGSSGSLFTKCERVSGPGPAAAAAAAISPKWTCGVAVDGRLSCQDPSSDDQTINLDINNSSAPTPGAEPSAAPAEPADSTTAGSSSAATQPNAAAQPSANATAGGFSAGKAGAAAGGSANAGAAGSASPAPTDVIGGGNSTAGAANTGGTFAVQAEPAAAAATPSAGPQAAGGARRLMQPPASPAPSPKTTLAPSGALSTGSFTSGPGSFSSGTSSVSGPAGTTTQTTSSTGGAPPATTAAFSNPVYIPDVPANAFAEGNGGAPSPSPSQAAASPSPSPAPEASPAASPSPSPPVAAFATSPAAAAPSASPSPSPSSPSPSPTPVPSAPQPSSVRISTSSGPAGGLALVNVACAAAGNSSLAMLNLV